jgi:hypothetical protein
VLKILAYTPSESDEKKFLYSNRKHLVEKELKIEHLANVPEVGQSTSTQQYLMELSDKVFEMG